MRLFPVFVSAAAAFLRPKSVSHDFVGDVRESSFAAHSGRYGGGPPGGNGGQPPNRKRALEGGQVQAPPAKRQSPEKTDEDELARAQSAMSSEQNDPEQRVSDEVEAAQQEGQQDGQVADPFEALLASRRGVVDDATMKPPSSRPARSAS